MAHDMQDQAYDMYMTAKAAKVEPNPKTKKKMEAAIANLPSVYCEPRVRRRIAHLCKYFGNPKEI